jgi:hypothetical protein
MLAASPGGDVWVAVVSDGAGSARWSKHGAELTCAAVMEGARRYFARHIKAPADAACRGWINDARQRIARAARRQKTEPR